MLTFLSIALLIYGSMHLYAFARLWQVLPHSAAVAVLLATAAVLLTLSPFLVWYLERQSWHRATSFSAWFSYSWMGYLFLFLCCGLLLDLAQGLAALLHLDWPFSAARQFFAIALLALAATAYAMLEARHIRIERVTITTPKLARGKLTIAQLSDMHLGIMQGAAFLDSILQQLRELKPDMVVATGDIVDGQGDDLAALARRFHGYTAPLGAYAVTGNHEFYAGLESSLAFLRAAGFTVLRGESARAGGIMIVGVDDPAVQSGNGAAYTTADLNGTRDFILLLKHQPLLNELEPFDLQLSGHVHGGQIFPFNFLTRLSYRFGTGLTGLADGRKLYVSRGAGTWGPTLRLFAPPEITLITLVSTHP